MGLRPDDLHLSVASVLERRRCELAEYRRDPSKTYVATAQNTKQFLRVGVQAVNGSGPGSPSYSSLIGVGTTPPPAPTPVTGGQTVVIAEGVTLNLKSVKRTRAGVKRSFAVIANTSNIKGKVRISIVDAAGRERRVVAKGRWLKPLGASTKRALKRKRISRSLSPGTYTVKTVFTPTPASRQLSVATMSKGSLFARRARCAVSGRAHGHDRARGPRACRR